MWLIELSFVLAGGGLALALMQRLRELGLPQPRAAVLLSPWVDLTARGGSIDAHGLYDYLSARLQHLPGLRAVESAPLIRTLKRAGTILAP